MYSEKFEVTNFEKLKELRNSFMKKEASKIRAAERAAYIAPRSYICSAASEYAFAKMNKLGIYDDRKFALLVAFHEETSTEFTDKDADFLEYVKLRHEELFPNRECTAAYYVHGVKLLRAVSDANHFDAERYKWFMIQQFCEDEDCRDCPYKYINGYYAKKLERLIKRKLPMLNHMKLYIWASLCSDIGYYVGTYGAIENTISEDVYERIKQQKSTEHEVEQLSSARILRSAFGCIRTHIQRKKAEEEIRVVVEELIKAVPEQADEKQKSEKDFNADEEAEMKPAEPVAEAAAPDVFAPLWAEKLSNKQCICKLISEGDIGRKYLKTIYDEGVRSCGKCLEIFNQMLKDEEFNELNTKYRNYNDLKIAAGEMYIDELLAEPLQDDDSKYIAVIKVLFNTDSFKTLLRAEARDMSEITGYSIFSELIKPIINKETYAEWTTAETIEAFKALGEEARWILERLETQIKENENKWNDKSQESKPQEPIYIRKNQKEVKVDIDSFVGNKNYNNNRRSSNYKKHLPVYNRNALNNTDAKLKPSATKEHTKPTRRCTSKKQVNPTVDKITISEDHSVTILYLPENEIKVITIGEFSEKERNLIKLAFITVLFDVNNLDEAYYSGDEGEFNLYDGNGNLLLDMKLTAIDEAKFTSVKAYIKSIFRIE